MRRKPPGIVARIRAGAKIGSAIGIGVLGAGSAVATTLGLVGLEVFAVAFGVAAVSAVTGAYAKGRLTYIPPAVLDEMGTDARCVARRVNAAELRMACELTKPYYGQEYVDFAVAEKWRRKNGDAFFQIVNEKGEMASCIGFIAVENSCFDEFIRGRLRDAEFDSDDILGASETRFASRLYLSGVIVKDADRYIGSKRATMMAWATLRYYEKYFGLRRKREIFALAVSEDGANMLRHLGFTLRSKASSRKDKCDLYSLMADKKAFDNMKRIIPDWSQSCDLSAVL